MQCKYVSEFDIQALVDNELEWEEEKRIHAYLTENPTARKYYEEMLEQKNRLKKWWRGKEH
jgi:anti-sigma factor RsiW